MKKMKDEKVVKQPYDLMSPPPPPHTHTHTLKFTETELGTIKELRLILSVHNQVKKISTISVEK